jgi:hypothetical protein
LNDRLEALVSSLGRQSPKGEGHFLDGDRRDACPTLLDAPPRKSGLHGSGLDVLAPNYLHRVNPVLNRGGRRELIFLDDEDRQRFVATLGAVCANTAVDLPQKSTKGAKTLMTFPSLHLAKNKR